MFVHKRLRLDQSLLDESPPTLWDQSPPTSEIKWLCVNLDGYKIVNVYNPPQTRLQSIYLPVFLYSCLYTGKFECLNVDWGYNNKSPYGECLAGWTVINSLALLYNAKNIASFYYCHWNTGTNSDLAFASVGFNSRLPERRVLDTFPRSQLCQRLGKPYEA